MSIALSIVLLTVFLVHLVAFAVLGLRRREGYYVALVVTFAMLSVAVGIRLAGSEMEIASGLMLHEALRYAAWAAAAISISWTLARIAGRVRQRGRQNCS